MSLRLVVPFALALLPFGAGAGNLAVEFAKCRKKTEPDQRLLCYDNIHHRMVGEVFQGKGSALTPEFNVTSPRLLSFESDDVVMVVYLLDEEGEVVRNLHRGGAGSGVHLIRTPGRYHLQINATGGWSVTLSEAE